MALTFLQQIGVKTIFMSMNRKPSILHDILREWPYAADKLSLVRAQLDRRDPIDLIEQEEVGRLLYELTDQGPEVRAALAKSLTGHRWRHAAQAFSTAIGDAALASAELGCTARQPAEGSGREGIWAGARHGDNWVAN